MTPNAKFDVRKIRNGLGNVFLFTAMPHFDRKRFFNGIREFLESKDVELTQKRVDAIEFLISSFETEPKWKDIRHIAYAFATIAHETAWTFEPIKEYRAKVGSKGRANQDRYWLSGYFGRGYVQLTWKKNYAKFGLAEHPEKALEPPTAFFILTEGMHKGIFTGKKLDDYINDVERDYINARRIINGIDKAFLLASYAKAFEQILRDSKQNSAAVHTANQPNGVQPTATHDKGSNSSAEQPPDFTEGERPADTDSGAAPGATHADASMSPQVIDKEHPSLFTRVMTGIIASIATAIAGITTTCGGNEVANMVARQGAERIVQNAERSDLQTFGLVVAYIVVGLGAAILLFYIASKIWEKSSERANSLNKQKIAAAADKLANTVEFKS